MAGGPVRVVVVGGGLGGLAAAARLAKLGHSITLLEAAPHLGGALTSVTAEGFTWDAGPTTTLLPAVLRDLFRKSGRPLERELDLEPLPVARMHVFEDGSHVAIPTGSRGAQGEAFESLGHGLGERWLDFLAPYGDVWEVLRRGYLEVPHTGSPEVDALLNSRETLGRRLRRTFRDERLRLVAGHRWVAEGHDLRNVPWWLGVMEYVEQNFGTWTITGGMARLTTALEARLATRGVTVLTAAPALDLVLASGRVAGVRTASGVLDAEVVVAAVDPRQLPALRPLVERTMPAIPPVVAHLGLVGDAPDLPGETVFHGDPLLVVRPGGSAPPGHSTLTVHGRGKLAEDLLRALARRGLDVREQVVVRQDRSPLDQVTQWRGSPFGVLWQGRATVRHRLGPRTPIPGVYAAGAHAAPGAGVPFTGLSGALVARAVQEDLGLEHP